MVLLPLPKPGSTECGNVELHSCAGSGRPRCCGSGVRHSISRDPPPRPRDYFGFFCQYACAQVSLLLYGLLLCWYSYIPQSTASPPSTLHGVPTPCSPPPLPPLPICNASANQNTATTACAGCSRRCQRSWIAGMRLIPSYRRW